MRIEHLFLAIATIGLVSIVALSNIDRPAAPGNAAYITLKDARVGEIRIVKDCGKANKDTCKEEVYRLELR